MPSLEVPDGSVVTSTGIGRQSDASVAASATTVAGAAAVAHPHDHRIERLIERLPQAMQAPTHWLRRPSLRWVRIPAGVLLLCGSVLSILPFFGIWMLPLGLMLLAEDVPPLRRLRGRVLDWIAHGRPNGLAEARS
jgi:hypothetical protein